MSAAPELDRSVAPAPAPLRSFDFPETESARLQSGLRVCVAPIHRLPVVTFTLLLPVGGSSEPSDRSGLASFTAALLEAGAGDRDAAEIAEALESIGAELDVGVSWDATHAGVTVLSSRLPEAVAILASLLREPSFPAPEIERLRGERIAEIMQRRTEPRSLAGEVTARTLYDEASPYGRRLIGGLDSLAGLTRQDILAYHGETFRPAGATLLAAGDVTSAQVAELAGEHFGGWAGARATGTVPPVRPRAQAPRITVVDRPAAAQAELRVARIGVDRATPDYFPLTVMNSILGGSFSSRLNLNLRERNGYTYGAQSGFAMRRQPGPFVISAAVQTEVSAAALREVFAEVRLLRDHGPTEEELSAARNYIAGVFPLRLQTTAGVVSRLAEVALYELPEDYLQTYRERVQSVSAADVQRVAREQVPPDELKVIIVGDANTIKPLLEAEGFEAVQVITPDAL